MAAEIDRSIRLLADHPLVAQHRILAQSETGETIFEVVPSSSFPAPAFGLFYFSDQDKAESNDDYRLYVESARKADALGLDAIWTPERHFTSVGAASPNPSVLSAALAMVTDRIALRAGSVVLPLHHPVRVAEEWAIVDRLSGGRAGVSFASGWVQDDFIFAPDLYADRRAMMANSLRQVQDLWAGKPVQFRNGAGRLTEVAIRPRPIQSVLPVWLTAAATRDTFALAGRLGVNVLTALLQLSSEQLEENIGVYRAARAGAGFDPKAGNVTVMLHTYLLDDAEEALREARPLLRSYFAAQTALRHAVAKNAGKQVGENPHLSDRLLDYSVDKFLRDRSLIGSPASVEATVQRLTAAGVDEFACLIDFGIPPERANAAIDQIAELKMAAFRKLEAELNQAIGYTPEQKCMVRVTARPGFS